MKLPAQARPVRRGPSSVPIARVEPSGLISTIGDPLCEVFCFGNADCIKGCQTVIDGGDGLLSPLLGLLI
ncbi:hypothetical protein NR798_34900 [Archangium gephyra]|uniref:hypothetical protein n=1 Tax=Archangium gephyra TaxID=48 RepID=UPI0035D439D0